MKKILFVLCCILLISGCDKKISAKDQALENNFKSAVSLYYQENVIGKAYPPFSCTAVTINDMKDAGIDVNEYINASCDATGVAAVVVVTDYSDPANIKYEIVSNLTCKNFSSKISEETKSTYNCLSTYLSK